MDVFMRWKIGDYIFDEKSNQLYLNNTPTLLEPKPSAVLKYLICNEGKDVSRDDLMAAVWPNQIVSDNAVNRVIVQLRKSLNDNDKTKRYIVTVPKIGYRFIATCESVSEITQANPQYLEHKSKDNIKIGSLMAFMVLAVIAIGFTMLKKDSVNNKVPVLNPNITPLTRHADMQFNGILAPDNQRLAYVTWGEDGFNHIMYRPAVNDRVVKISLENGHGSNPMWSPDSKSLVYVYNTKNRCEFHLIKDVTQKLAPDAVYSCPLNSEPLVLFGKNANTLYFTEKAAEYAPYYAYKLDIRESKKTQLAQPIPQGIGNHYIDYDENSDRLLLVNESRLGKSTVYSLDTTTSTYQKLIDLNYGVMSAIWGHQPNTIVHPGIHPSYHLIQTDFKLKTSDVLISDSRRISYPKRVNNKKDYLFTSYLFNRDIRIDKDIDKSINSSVVDYIPAMSSDGNSLAFISKRSGFSQIWIYSITDNNLKAIDTKNDGREFYSLEWSFDNNRILANSSLGLVIVDAKKSRIMEQYTPDSPTYGAGWYSMNEVSFSQWQHDRWQAYTYNIDTKQRIPMDENISFIMSNAKSHLFFDQKLDAIISANKQSYNQICGEVISRFSLTARFTEEGVYCRAKNTNQIILVDLGGDIVPLKEELYQYPFYSIYDRKIVNVELTSVVGDIMRSNFDSASNN